MWVLQLNDMRSAKYEHVEPVACAETREKLEEYITNEKVGTYKDGLWCKTFRKGGPLEWFNEPHDGVDYFFLDIGTEEDLVRRRRKHLSELVQV